MIYLYVLARESTPRNSPAPSLLKYHFLESRWFLVFWEGGKCSMLDYKDFITFLKLPCMSTE
jgi:hypothetical protein